jgi:hypothetical protein
MEFTNWVLSEATGTFFAPRGATEIANLFTYYGEMLSFNMITPAEAANAFYAEAAAIIERHKD